MATTGTAIAVVARMLITRASAVDVFAFLFLSGDLVAYLDFFRCWKKKHYLKGHYELLF